jgi:hypothetical protein
MGAGQFVGAVAGAHRHGAHAGAARGFNAEGGVFKHDAGCGGTDAARRFQKDRGLGLAGRPSSPPTTACGHWGPCCRCEKRIQCCACRPPCPRPPSGRGPCAGAKTPKPGHFGKHRAEQLAVDALPSVDQRPGLVLSHRSRRTARACIRRRCARWCGASGRARRCPCRGAAQTSTQLRRGRAWSRSWCRPCRRSGDAGTSPGAAAFITRPA